MKHLKKVSTHVPAQANILTWPVQVKTVLGQYINMLFWTEGSIDFSNY